MKKYYEAYEKQWHYVYNEIMKALMKKKWKEKESNEEEAIIENIINWRRNLLSI